MAPPRGLCERLRRAAEELVGAGPAQHALGAVGTSSRQHLDLHRDHRMPDGRAVGAVGEELDPMRGVLRRDANDLAPEVALERTEMRPVVAGPLEVEADRRAARAFGPCDGEPHEHRGVDAAARHDRDPTDADERRIDGVDERAPQRRRGVGEPR